jgi:DNA-binding transcriptional regulator GbsR (MarR family)
MNPPPHTSESPAAALAPWETSVVEIFVRAASLIGLPRSIGEIYGLLFCAHQPMTFDDLVTRLGISRGSVSQGLKLLRQLGAVKLHYIAGNRKDHYVPELSMKRLVSGFVRDQFSPHIESGAGRIDQVEALVASESDPSIREHALNRLGILSSWQKRVQRLLPVVMAALSGAKLFEKSSSDEETII